MRTWCWWEGSTSPRWRVSGSVSAASSGSEKKRDTVLLTVAQTTTWCERRAAEQDVPHIVLFYAVCFKKNPHKNPYLFHYNVPPRPTRGTLVVQ